MAQIKLDLLISITDNSGSTKKIPITYSHTSVNEITPMELDIAADAKVIVFDPVNWTGYPMSDFDTLVMYADGDLDIEMTINEGDANEELDSFRLKAGAPFILGSNVAYYNHSASDIFAGTLDVIDKIRVDEPNSAAVKLNMILVS